MRPFLLVLAITVVGFAAGVAAGMWYEGHRPLPPPPVPFGAEFWHGPRSARRNGPINRRELIERIEALQPQLEAFQQRMNQIDAQFDHDLDAVLNDQQRAKHAEEMKRRHVPNAADTRPISDDQISWMLRDGATRTVLSDVVIPFRLDSLTREYKLDDGQRDKVRTLLLVRRGQFLALVDSSPPPSVALSRLAQMMQRLKAPPAQPGPPRDSR